MKVMQITRNKQDLTPEQWEEFKSVIDKFYASPPEDMTIIADYVAVDQSASFILLEVPSLERLEEINEPFTPFVDSEKATGLDYFFGSRALEKMWISSYPRRRSINIMGV